MTKQTRTLFILSDGTGITLEHLVRTLISQFDPGCCRRVILPFLDTRDAMEGALRRVSQAAAEDSTRPVVFSSIVDPELRALLQQADAEVFDIFDTFLPALSSVFGMPAAGQVGRSHGVGDRGEYDRRVDAVNFALNFDDGSRLKGIAEADLILIGVSRCGKTPTCLYLAMQYAVRAANFPLTEDDFMLGRLPASLEGHRPLLFGLTISAERLHRIREERRPGSEYASIAQCRREVSAAEALYRNNAIPFLDSTEVSIEELSIEIMQRAGVSRNY
jgi:[pyruvate, water dikinase]-phosphate phosphotransferase / [pyruvate, water dikinase] kinase